MTDLDPKLIERIYREMGKLPCVCASRTNPGAVYVGEGFAAGHFHGDPLTDWSAFGEILEWAEHEGFTWYKEFDVWVARHRDGRLGEGDGPEREARLAALSEAVRE